MKMKVVLEISFQRQHPLKEKHDEVELKLDIHERRGKGREDFQS